jgi:heme/copper-type cytochrome/quinol oxidase subunit 4
MQVARAQQPIAAAAVTLVVWVICVAAFLPPLNTHITDSVPLVIIAGLGIAVSLVLHLIFIGMAARRLGRSAVLWVIVALCFLPIASIVGLILFEWFSEQEKEASV